MSRIEVEADCRDLVVRALRALDARDYKTVALSFAQDGLWERGGEVLVGRVAVRAALEKRPADLETQHIASNLVVDLEGDGAATVCYTILAYTQTAAAAYHLHSMYNAIDRLGRTAEGWRFIRRAVVPSFTPRV